jgi:phosphatidylserine/phosphatidylglycerophosphate/cardiolipin synthase-like enzyme
MARSVWRRTVATAAATGLIGAGAGFAGHDKASAAFNPQAGPIFNNPEGDPAAQYAIMRQIENNIDAAPKGSVIRFAFYSINLQEFADKLIAAHRRGVYVRILMDQHSQNAIWKKLVSALGSKVNTKTSASSYAALCYGGCLAHHYVNGQPTSWLHSKYYLFSGGGRRTVTVSSANPTDTQAEVAWNNSYTAVGNDGLYNAYVKNFSDMSNSAATGKYQPKYYWTYGSNPKAYYWPKAKGDSDTILGMLQLVTCSKTYPSQVRVAMFQWSDNRIALAKQLSSMASKGCKVSVIYTKDQVSSGVRSTLANSKVDVRDSTHGSDGAGYAEHYTHNKYLLIDGRYGGVSGRRVVMTGSQNYTDNGLYHNDESDLKLISSTTYLAYLANFNDQLASVPSVTAKQRALGQKPTIPVDPRQADDS